MRIDSKSSSMFSPHPTLCSRLRRYNKLSKPKWTPPNAVFGPVWGLLYAGMGVASWLVFKQGGWAAQVQHSLHSLTMRLACPAGDIDDMLLQRGTLQLAYFDTA